MLCGGTSEEKEIKEEVEKICHDLKEKIEEHIGHKMETFKPTKYKDQVVAGTNYFVKIDIGNGDCVHVRIYQDLQRTISLHGAQKKKQEDPLDYF